MSIPFSTGGKVREASGILAGVGGKVREIKEVYAGKDGKPVLVWKNGFQDGYIYHTSALAYYSKDLINWVPLSKIDGGSFAHFYYVNDQLRCYNYSNVSKKIYATTNGKTWKVIGDTPTGSSIFANGKFVFVKSSYNEITLYHSTDGINFETTTLSVTTEQLYYGVGIYYLDDEFFMLRAGRIYRSKDAVNWTIWYSVRNLSSSYTFKPGLMASDGRIIVAIDTDGTRILQSIAYIDTNDTTGWKFADIYWKPVDDLVCGNGTFVAVGSGPVVYSRDGANWNSIDLYLRRVIFDGKRFVGIKAQPYTDIVVSEDGINWSTVYSFDANEIVTSTFPNIVKIGN